MAFLNDDELDSGDIARGKKKQAQGAAGWGDDGGASLSGEQAGEVDFTADDALPEMPPEIEVAAGPAPEMVDEGGPDEPQAAHAGAGDAGGSDGGFEADAAESFEVAPAEVQDSAGGARSMPTEASGYSSGGNVADALAQRERLLNEPIPVPGHQMALDPREEMRRREAGRQQMEQSALERRRQLAAIDKGLKAQGVVFEPDEAGGERIAYYQGEDGVARPRFKPGVVSEFEWDQDGRPVRSFRDEFGNVRSQDIREGIPGRDFKRDPESGEFYVDTKAGRQWLGMVDGEYLQQKYMTALTQTARAEDNVDRERYRELRLRAQELKAQYGDSMQWGAGADLEALKASVQEGMENRKRAEAGGESIFSFVGGQTREQKVKRAEEDLGEASANLEAGQARAEYDRLLGEGREIQSQMNGRRLRLAKEALNFQRQRFGRRYGAPDEILDERARADWGTWMERSGPGGANIQEPARYPQSLLLPPESDGGRAVVPTDLLLNRAQAMAEATGRPVSQMLSYAAQEARRGGLEVSQEVMEELEATRKKYRVKANGGIHFDRRDMEGGLRQAIEDGVVKPEDASQMMREIDAASGKKEDNKVGRLQDFAWRSLITTSNRLNTTLGGLARFVGADDLADNFAAQARIGEEELTRGKGGIVNPALEDSWSGIAGRVVGNVASAAPALLGSSAGGAAAGAVAIGRVAALAPRLVGMAPMLVDMSATASEGAYQQAKAVGKSDEQASKLANEAALGVLPHFALYMGAGALTNIALRPLTRVLPVLETPWGRAAAAYAVDAPLNVAASGAIRMAEGGEFWDMDAEGVATDLAFSFMPAMEATQAAKYLPTARAMADGSHPEILLHKAMAGDRSMTREQRMEAAGIAERMQEFGGRVIEAMGARPDAPAIDHQAALNRLRELDTAPDGATSRDERAQAMVDANTALSRMIAQEPEAMQGVMGELARDENRRYVWEGARGINPEGPGAAVLARIGKQALDSGVIPPSQQAALRRMVEGIPEANREAVLQHAVGASVFYDSYRDVLRGNGLEAADPGFLTVLKDAGALIVDPATGKTKLNVQYLFLVPEKMRARLAGSPGRWTDAPDGLVDIGRVMRDGHTGLEGAEPGQRFAEPRGESEGARPGDSTQNPPESTPENLKGEQINREWTSFSEESGSLGVPRAEMPQIKAEARGALTQFLGARGIGITHRNVRPGELKPTQAEYSQAKVDKARGFKGGDRAILVSSDGHVVDGHHQWMAKLTDAPEAPIRVIEFDAPIRELLPVIHEFPSTERAGGVSSSTRRTGEKSARESAEAIERQLSAEEALRRSLRGAELLKGELAEQQHVSDVLEAFRQDVSENRSADELREFLQDPPADFKELPFWNRIRDYAEKSLETKAAEEARMEEEYRREQREALDEALAETSPTGEDLLAAIKRLGGLPSRRALESDRFGDSELAGEVDRLREFARHGSADGKRGVFYSDLFRNDAPSMDQLRNRLTEHGFDFSTVDEMLSAIEGSIVSGQRAYGERATAAAALADVTPFSRSTKEPKKLKASQVEEVVSTAKSRWKNLPGDAIEVVQGYSDLPDGIRQRMQEAGAEGAYHNGKVYIVADKLERPSDALRVAIHEVVGHYGLRGALGDLMNRAMDEVALRNTKGVRKVAERLGLDLRDPVQRREAAEEYIAESASPTRLRNVIDFLKRALQKVFPGLKFEDDYVRQLLQTSREYLESGRKAVDGAGLASFADKEKGQARLREFAPRQLRGMMSLLGRKEATPTNRLPQESLDASGETRFARAAVGMKLKDVGRDFVRDDVDPQLLNVRGTDTEVVIRAAEAFKKWPERTRAADGSNILLKNAESGSIGARVRHLIFDHDANRIHAHKAQWLSMVPETLEHAAVRLIDAETGNRIYVREYRSGQKHLVIVRPDGSVADQKPFTGRLITQFPEGGRSRQAYMKIDWVREEGKGSGRFQGNPRPTPTDSTHPDARQSDFRDQSTPTNRPSQGNLDGSGETRYSRGKSADKSDLPDRGPVVEQGLKGWRRVFDGAADVLKRTKGLEELGDKVRHHMDRARQVQGRVSTQYLKLERNEGKKAFRQAEREVEAFYREKDGGDDMAAAEIERTMSPAAKEHLATWRRVAQGLGQWAQRLDVQVQQADGKYRKMGMLDDYHPRIVRREVIEAVRDPHKHPELFREVVKEMKEAGLAKSAEEVVEIFGQGGLLGEVSNDHFGNIEKARQLELPSKLYDYSFEARRRYMLQSIERLAQIEAYGQSGNGKMDAFEQAVAGGKIRDARTAEYVNAVRDRVYGVTNRNFWNRTMGFLNAVATGSMLANPVTIGVNLTSGMGYTATTFGYRNTLKGLWEARRYGQLAMEAREKGVIPEDLMSLQDDADKLGSTAISKAQSFTGKMLKYSGYNLSEEIVRTTALGAAKAYIRNALSVHAQRPESRKAKLINAEFKRMGVDPQKIYEEGGKGKETDKFYRAAINAGQGGYKVDQTPIYMDTPAGRFFFKYQKWGAQASRNFMLHVVEPTIGRNGPRDFKPLFRYLATTALVGAGIQVAKESLFGTPAQEASFEEIAKKWSEGDRAAIGDLMEKLFSAQLTTGAFGMLGNYTQAFSDVAERSRFKSPLEPAGIGTIANAGEQLFRLIEQGKLTIRDLDDYVRAQISFYRTAKAAAGRAGLNATEAGKQDARWLAVQTRRFAKEMGVTASRTQLGRMAKTPDSPIVQDLQDALMTGDIDGAKNAAARYLDRARNPEERTARLRSLRQSVYMRQPLRVGSAGEARRELFLTWAKQYLPAEDMARVRRIDSTYRQTAEKSGLFTPRGAKPKQILQQQRKWAANTGQ